MIVHEISSSERLKEGKKAKVAFSSFCGFSHTIPILLCFEKVEKAVEKSSGVLHDDDEAICKAVTLEKLAKMSAKTFHFLQSAWQSQPPSA